jgi:hypothetical protein
VRHVFGEHLLRGVDQDVGFLGREADEPITVTGVANLDKLQVFDAVYSAVRGAPFATAPR